MNPDLAPDIARDPNLDTMFSESPTAHLNPNAPKRARSTPMSAITVYFTNGDGAPVVQTEVMDPRPVAELRKVLRDACRRTAVKRQSIVLYQMRTHARHNEAERLGNEAPEPTAPPLELADDDELMEFQGDENGTGWGLFLAYSICGMTARKAT